MSCGGVLGYDHLAIRMPEELRRQVGRGSDTFLVRMGFREACGSVQPPGWETDPSQGY